MNWRLCEQCGEEYLEKGFFVEEKPGTEFIPMGIDGEDEIYFVGQVRRFITYCPKGHIVGERKQKVEV